MVQNNSIIEIGIIENTGEHSDQIGILTAQFVSYPDCQQLKVWLPKSKFFKSNFGKYVIVNHSTNKIEEQGLVEEKVSGSVQMLFNTLCFSDGSYTLEIEHPLGGKLCLYFQKHIEGFESEKPVLNPESSTEDSLWRVYKDGFGNDIPNEDQAMRKGANTELGDVIKSVLKSEYEIAASLKFDTEIINQALTFSAEWGENFQKPIHERMMKKYPELSFEMVDILQTYVRQAENFIYELAEQVCTGTIAESDIKMKARRQFFWINKENVSRLAGIGMYYANK